MGYRRSANVKNKQNRMSIWKKSQTRKRIEIFSSPTVGWETFMFSSEENSTTNARIAYPLA